MKAFAANGRRALALAAVASLLVFMTGIATANAETTAASKDELKLNTEITMLNKDVTMPYGEQVVTDRLTKTFDVKGDRIKSLRDKKLGYGEIAAVLAFADKMSGGISDENINKIMTLKERRTGWSQIAGSLNVDLGDVAGKVGSVEEDAHKDIKKAAVERPAGRGAGGVTDSGAGGVSESPGGFGEERY